MLFGSVCVCVKKKMMMMVLLAYSISSTLGFHLHLNSDRAGEDVGGASSAVWRAAGGTRASGRAAIEEVTASGLKKPMCCMLVDWSWSW